MQTFEMNFYCQRRGHNDTYRFKYQSNGRNFSSVSVKGLTDKFGHLQDKSQNTIFMHPECDIYRSFLHDSVCYPENFGGLLGYIHEQVGIKSDEETQSLFNELGEFISLIEQNKPNWNYIPEDDE